ncbi:hypothetical protein BH20VER1_BH20VER1_06540 [soil metagenome]
MSAAAATPESHTAKAAPPLEFPDDPRKWNGWSHYQAENLYTRLCLDPAANPTDLEIQQHYNALLQWWQKKLPLKNQPSNPLAQLLGRGLDEAGRHLAQAQPELLDRGRRRDIDTELAAAAQADVLVEFSKYVAFSIKKGLLTPEAEANLREFGQRHNLHPDQIGTCIDEALRQNNARRSPPAVATPPARPVRVFAAGEAETEFFRILRLSEVHLGSATESVRRIFASIAHNLGIELEDAQDLLDDYLEKEELALCQRREIPTALAPAVAGRATLAEPMRMAFTPPPEPACFPLKPEPGALPPSFHNPVGAPMLLIPAGKFIMGSEASDAAPNEQPLTPIKLSQFYMSRHPVTNAEYEQFDSLHRQKRIASAGDDHPVVYVTSLEAIKFADWLGQKMAGDTGSRPRRNGSTPPVVLTVENFHGAMTIGRAIWQISPMPALPFPGGMRS